MTYEQIFKEVKKYFKKADVAHFTQEFAFQFNIIGEGQGIFYAAFKNGVFSVEPYDYVDRDVIFEADGKTLKEIASGKLEAIDAIKEGKLTVDGNHELAKQLMFLLDTNKTAAEPAEKKPVEKKPAESKPKVSVKKEAPKEAPKAAAKGTGKSKTSAKKNAKPATVSKKK